MPAASFKTLCLGAVCTGLSLLAPPTASRAQAPPPAATATEYQPPRLLKRTPLSYPEVAKLNRLQGVVRVLLTVDETGRVSDATLMTASGSLLLDQCVSDPRLREWTFQPALLRGRPVTGTFEQELEFKLDPEEQRALGVKRAALPPTAGTPEPPYPEAARAKGLRGSVILSGQWGENGLVERIYLQKSSGSGLLDVTALRWAYENWRVDRQRVPEVAFERTINFDPAVAPKIPAR